MARFPFTVAFAYTRDETNHLADVLLPEATDLESLQLIRIGGSKFVEQFWDCTRASRCASRRSRRRARRATSPPSRPSSRGAPACSTSTTPSINKGAAGVPLKGPHCDVSARARRRASAGGDLGRRLPRGERRGDRRTRVARPRLVPRARFRDPAVPAHQVVPVPDAGGEGPALRAALPGAAAARSAPSSAAACTSTTCTGGTSSCPSTRRCRSARTSARRGSAALEKAGGKPQDYPFWLLTARSMQYAWGANVGMQLIKEVADNVAGHKRRDHEHAGGRAARHRRRRPGDDRHAAAPRARARRAAAGHPARHAADDRPVRPLGDAATPRTSACPA